MFDPPHPGLTLRDDVLPALGLTVTEAAGQLGVSRVTLSRVLNGHAAISPEMALRLEAWVGAGAWRRCASVARPAGCARPLAGWQEAEEDAHACDAGARIGLKAEVFGIIDRSALPRRAGH